MKHPASLICSFHAATLIAVFTHFFAGISRGECLAADWFSQAGRQFVEGLAKNFAPQSYRRPPDWAYADREPLFRIAWISDMHLDGSRIDAIIRRR